jgi:hypothetical protein
MAAVAKTSTPPDGRVPCPLCGGLVHPLAGKCKHCKAELAEARGARPQAAAALPALSAGGPRRADGTPVPTPVKAIAAAAAAQPILPPRTTTRLPATAPKSSLLRNWPVVVIILAGLAIAAAVVIMIWPASQHAKADTRLPPPPAPDRMSTDPLAPQGSLTPPAPPDDPWAQPAPRAPTAPKPNPRSPPDDPQDPLKGMSSRAVMMFNVLVHACDRMTACGNSQLADNDDTCAGLSSMSAVMPAMTPTCPAATRCLRRIDELDCNTTLSNPKDVLSLILTLSDCVDAQRC